MDYKSFREMLKSVFLALFIVGTFACSASPRVNLQDDPDRILPNAEEEVIVKELVNLFETVHYKKVPFNDSLSNIIYDNIIKSLDGGKNYLLKEDVDKFETYKNTILEDFKKGDLSAAFFMFNVFEDRYMERLNYALSQVDQTYDFTSDERFTADREDMEWFKDEREAEETWKQRVKYDLLRLRLSSSDSVSIEDNKETLRNRYTNLISQAEKTNNNDVFQVLMNAFTSGIDPHTNYFNPSFAMAFNEDMALTFEGIGARLMLENEVVKIVEIIPGGPADKSKALNVNDRIVGVAQGDGDFVDIVGWRLDRSVSKIKGPKGTDVRLKIIPSGQDLTAKPKIITLTRDRIVLEDMSAKKIVKTVQDTEGNSRKIGVITLPQFYMDFKAYNSQDPNYKSASRDVARIIDTLKQEQVDGIVIDLRGNGGGSLIEAIKLTGLFIDKGPVVQVRDTRNRIEVDQDEEAGTAWDGPLAVMVNRLSASASEIFAAAIQDYGRGIILGTQSYGKGTVQSAIDMSKVISPTNQLLLKARASSEDSMVLDGAPEYGQINLTMAKFYRITGSSTQHKGVMPDIRFPMMIPADEFGESAEPSALPWDQIKSTPFTKVENLQPMIQVLEAGHKARMEKSPEYHFMLEDIKELAERKDKDRSVSLNEEVLKQERDQEEQEALDRLNARRKIQGLPVLKKGDPIPSEPYDFILDESLKVISDMVNYMQGSGQAQNAA